MWHIQLHMWRNSCDVWCNAYATSVRGTIYSNWRTYLIFPGLTTAGYPYQHKVSGLSNQSSWHLVDF